MWSNLTVVSRRHQFCAVKADFSRLKNFFSADMSVTGTWQKVDSQVRQSFHSWTIFRFRHFVNSYNKTNSESATDWIYKNRCFFILHFVHIYIHTYTSTYVRTYIGLISINNGDKFYKPNLREIHSLVPTVYYKNILFIYILFIYIFID